MAKVYYWLKLDKDFFKGKEIKKLRKIAGGDTYTIIYLKLQLLSLKDEGKLYFDSIEDTFAEELALELDEDADNIAFVLIFLKKYGLVQAISDDEILLNTVPYSIGKETDKAELMRKKRSKEKELNGNIVTELLPSVTNCYTEKRREEKEIDKDINNNSASKDELNNIINEIWSLYPNKKGKADVIKKIPKILKTISKDEIIKSIERYKKDVENQRNNGFKTLNYANGSTFFNGRYMDYLEDTKEEVQQTYKPIDDNFDY